MANLVQALVEAPTRLQQYIDSCTCGRADKAAVTAIKLELEAKDAAIERLEEEIRRKDTEKDNLIHMQKDLQLQIEEIKRLMDAAAAKEDAVVDVKQQSRSAQMLQARVRGKSARRLVKQQAAEGKLPGQRRIKQRATEGTVSGATGEEAAEYPGELDPDDSVDSDYEYDDSEFGKLGYKLLEGELELAKVYGQEEPPAAEDELEWECRYFVLFDSGKICHFDALEDGTPVGDRGMIYLNSVKSVEKVLAMPTFVMKGTNKVYLLRLPNPDEVMMRTWIAAISQELNTAGRGATGTAAP